MRTKKIIENKIANKIKLRWCQNNSALFIMTLECLDSIKKIKNVRKHSAKSGFFNADKIERSKFNSRNLQVKSDLLHFIKRKK